MSTDFFDFGDALDGSSSSSSAIRRDAHIVNGGEGKAMVACIKCGGSGQTRWGPCFRCDGAGTITMRSAASSKARVSRQENIAAWQSEHHELIAFLQSIREWNNYAASLLSDIDAYGSLKPWKEEKAYTMMAKVQDGRERKAAERAVSQAATAPSVDISAIQALFDKATENDVKKPIFRTVDIVISKAPMSGKNPGALYVKRTDDQAYCGKIVGGKFFAGQGAPDVLEALRAVACDPGKEAIRYASKFSACGICGTTTIDPVSVRSAVGPVCARKWGLEHVREAARTELAAEREQEKGRA